MSTFKRYLIHFNLIGLIIILSLIVVILSTEMKKTDIRILLAGAISILLFSFSMAMCFSGIFAKNIEFTIMFNSEGEKEKLIHQIDEYAFNVAIRKIKTVNNNHIVYTSKNNYVKWLTNPIKVEVGNEHLKINVPKAYSEKLKKLLLYN